MNIANSIHFVFLCGRGGDIDNIKWKFRTGSIPIRFVASRAQVLRKSGPFGFSVPFRGPSAGRWYFIFRTRRQDLGDSALIIELERTLIWFFRYDQSTHGARRFPLHSPVHVVMQILI